MKILVIADIHGNAEALRAVLARERDADATVFLGDAVSPGPQANETAALLADVSGTFILGNHDSEMLDPGLVAGWPPPWRALHDWVHGTFDAAGFDLLRSFAPGGDFDVGGLALCLQHGSLPGKSRHALPDAPDDVLVEVAKGSERPLVLFGHTHVQFRRAIGGQEFINPGSVGQNRCGRLLACYGVFQDGAFEHRQAAYDPAPWLAALDRATPLDAYPEFRAWLRDGLLTGYGIGRREPWTRYARQGYC